MKNKLTALLAALLLCLSLLPSQAIAACDPVDSDPPVISEQEQSETPGSPISRTSAPAQAEDPDFYDREH